MIKLTNVTKKYSKVIAINDMTLDIKENGIYCLLGKNGAGKTTLMKLISGHIQATTGDVFIDNKLITQTKIPTCVNFIESHKDYFNLKIKDMIFACSVLQDNFDIEFANKMVEKYKLDINKKYKHLSFGMKTMLTSILNLSNNSKVILLDEPVLGFDPIMRNHFNQLLLESIENHPRIIIISTHLVDEIAKVCEYLILIDNGKLVLQTSLEEIDESTFILTSMSEEIEEIIKNFNCINKIKIGPITRAFIYDKTFIPDKRITIPDSITLEKMSLQDFFINYLGGTNND